MYFTKSRFTKSSLGCSIIKFSWHWPWHEPRWDRRRQSAIKIVLPSYYTLFKIRTLFHFFPHITLKVWKKVQFNNNMSCITLINVFFLLFLDKGDYQHHHIYLIFWHFLKIVFPRIQSVKFKNKTKLKTYKLSNLLELRNSNVH